MSLEPFITIAMVRRMFGSTLGALAIGGLQFLAARGVSSFAPPGGECRAPTRSRPPVRTTSATGERRRLSPSPTRASFSSAATSDETGDGEGSDGEARELSPATVAEMIEVSFLQSCLQLSQGYVDVLKLFIVAVKAGRDFPLPLEELHALVLECPVNSAGRDLMKEEVELRLEWMTLVYELLDALDSDAEAGAVGKSDGDGDATNSRISEVVKAMLSVQTQIQNEETTTGGKADAAVALNALTVEQVLERSPALSKLDQSLTSDPMGKAFLTNDIRVALMTFRVLEEERVCTEGASGLKGEVPRPPIPGT